MTMEFTYYDDEGREIAWYEAEEEEIVEVLSDLYYEEWFEEKMKKVGCPKNVKWEIKKCLEDMLRNDEHLYDMADFNRQELKEAFEDKAWRD